MQIPKSLQYVSDYIGDDATNRLLMQFSGMRVYAPTVNRLKPKHKLVLILGFEPASKLAWLIGGDY